MEEYTREKLVKLHSNRLLDELFVFIYKTGIIQSKAEAMDGYNDDLVMSYSIALWIRDTALRLRKDSDDRQRLMMDSMLENNGNTRSDAEVKMFNVKKRGQNEDPYKWEVGGEDDLRWLLK
tara:strand:- start:515 stop:877 length:363 start_codon:yes stop_codon:yes gene_type:complete